MRAAPIDMSAKTCQALFLSGRLSTDALISWPMLLVERDGGGVVVDGRPCVVPDPGSHLRGRNLPDLVQDTIDPHVVTQDSGHRLLLALGE